VKRLLISFIAGAAIWAWFSWPLPAHVASGIPAGARTSPCPARYMIPGDHVQLLYHFWLLGDMIAGRTPFFYNLYEFNTGDDAERREPGPYYVPFSLVCVVMSWLGGMAFGWNAMGLISIWLTLLFTWLLALRYTRDRGIAAIAAAIGVMLPVRWVYLLGGSPAGFAMMLAPMLLWGLDDLVRHGRFRGGVAAGLAILFASWVDRHVLFFGALVAPFWCLWVLFASPGGVKRSPRIILAGLPFIVLGLCGLAYLWSGRGEIEDSAHVAGGRSWREIALYSPRWAGLFAWHATGLQGHIFIGYVLSGVLLIGAIAALARLLGRGRGEPARSALLYLLLCAGLAGIVILALGTNGPLHGRVFDAVRSRLVPPYSMIRQPAKIYALMPALLAVAAALSLNAWFARMGRSAGRRTILALLGIMMAVEFKSQVRAEICLLDPDAPAYQAASEDAAESGRVARALVLPLWPGDSHYASIYQYCASRYRLRMMNGYRPVVSRKYVEDIFWRFESANTGWLADDQAAELVRRGVRYILLHEDLFPEKVSPFPVAFTLDRLMANPRLRLLTHARKVWCFKVLDEVATGAGRVRAPCPVAFPARAWEFEKGSLGGAEIVEEADASRGAVVGLAADGSHAALRAVRVPPVEGLRWLVRAKGPGALLAETVAGEAVEDSRRIEVESAGWQWVAIPFTVSRYGERYLRMTRLDGAVRLDAACLVAGDWPRLSPGESIEIPAACLFHGGSTDVESGEVFFDKDRDAYAMVLYGPKLPVDSGLYEMELQFASEAPAGDTLGVFHVETAEGRIASDVPVVSQERARRRFRTGSNLPIHLTFEFHRAADVTVRGIALRRL
jgi:hypothetical protein